MPAFRGRRGIWRTQKLKGLLVKEFKLTIRSKSGFGLALAFYGAFSILVPFGMETRLSALQSPAPAILWLGAVLSVLLSLDRIFQQDLVDGSLERLATTPTPLEAVVVAKMIANWVTAGLPLCALAVFLGLLFGLPLDERIWICVSLVAGTPALSAVGTFGASLSLGQGRGGLLLPVVVIPLCVPTLILGTLVVNRAAQGLAIQTVFLIEISISLASFALMPFASAYAVRTNLEYS